MTDMTMPRPLAEIRRPDLSATRLRRRYAAEFRFKFYGILALAIAGAMLALLLFSIVSKGYTAFWRTEITLNVYLDPAELDPANLATANYQALIRDSLVTLFPEVASRNDRRALSELVSGDASIELQKLVQADPSLIGQTIEFTAATSDDGDMLEKGYLSRDVAEADRQLNDKQIEWFDRMAETGVIGTAINTNFLTSGDSREPELAGVWGAVVGSFYTMLVTLLLAFPLAVATAIYLEEFAPKNRWTDVIEVNINNLAAVPSIVFGLLGLAIFLGFFGLPRSAPLVGGMVLALIVLPTIIIATRAALKAVPPSIREAAYGIGASRMQVVLHHVLPLAMPGVLTGTIIGMAHALGETAPLLMIGMVAFVVDIPAGPLDAATALPVQIFMWSDIPERGFVEKTSAAIMVLLTFLILMNAVAILLRRHFERRW